MPDKQASGNEGLTDKLSTQQIERIAALATARLTVLEDTLVEVRELRKETERLVETVESSYATRMEITDTRARTVFRILLTVVVIFQLYLAGFLRYCSEGFIPGTVHYVCDTVYPVLTVSGDWPSGWNAIGFATYFVVFFSIWGILHKRSG